MTRFQVHSAMTFSASFVSSERNLHISGRSIVDLGPVLLANVCKFIYSRYMQGMVNHLLVWDKLS